MPQSASLPTPVAEETQHLVAVRTWLYEHPEESGASEEDTVREVVRLQNEARVAKGEDRAAINQQVELLTAVLDQIRRGRPRESVDPDVPYFGHLRLVERRRTQDVFLGKATRIAEGVRIVDWRNAPISRLFYRYDEGDEYQEQMGGQVREGQIVARRTLHIAGGELLRVGTGDGTWVRGAEGWEQIVPGALQLAGGQGAALRAGSTRDAKLGAGTKLRADKHLPDIAALIDPDQFELITAPDSGIVVLRGSAGSGKTTVALHRVAYLNFARPDRYVPSRCLVVVWGRALRDYVDHVLPALGVSGVRVSTWEDQARTLVQRHFPRLPGRVAYDTPEPVTRVKVHPRVSEFIAEHIASRRGPASPEQALDDWATLFTDRGKLARLMGDELSHASVETVVEWCTAAYTNLHAWFDGDREADARLDAEDDALLLRTWQLRVGPLVDAAGHRLAWAHLALDEVQDFSPVEVQVLLGTCMSPPSVTLAGDTQQHIAGLAGFSSWSGFLERIGLPPTAAATLRVSYRSTHAVTRFALRVLGPLAEGDEVPTTLRDGPPVELFRFSDHGAAVAFLSSELKVLLSREPLANVAILAPDAELANLYFNGLNNAEVPELRRVTNQRFAFAPGIDVVEANEVKGLEFDYVIVVEASARCWPDTDHHRRLLYVAATRAVHQLWLTTVGTPSPLLPAENLEELP